MYSDEQTCFPNVSLTSLINVCYVLSDKTAVDAEIVLYFTQIKQFTRLSRALETLPIVKDI